MPSSILWLSGDTIHGFTNLTGHSRARLMGQYKSGACAMLRHGRDLADATRPRSESTPTGLFPLQLGIRPNVIIQCISCGKQSLTPRARNEPRHEYSPPSSRSSGRLLPLSPPSRGASSFSQSPASPTRSSSPLAERSEAMLVPTARTARQDARHRRVANGSRAWTMVPCVSDEDAQQG